MKLEKGKFYRVKKEEWMKHSRVEHHSSYKRFDGANLHNMIMRTLDNSLEIGLFLDSDIIKKLPDNTEI